MNNKTIISIVVVVVAILAGYWALSASDRNELTVQEVETVVKYNCEGGKAFEAGFSEGIVALSLDDGREITLEHISSDNEGNLYVNETGLTFLESARPLSRIEEDGEVIYADCMFERFDRQVRGEIVSIDSSAVPVDGPYYIDIDFKTIEGPNREGTTIMVPSMGINLCPARDNMADIATLSVGMTIEVNGYTSEGGYVRPCESEEHYLRVVDDGVSNENPGANDEDENGEVEPVFCTQEAKLCPDGSYVGRTGSNCEFAPCPGE